jgi:hypothetical protein
MVAVMSNRRLLLGTSALVVPAALVLSAQVLGAQQPVKYREFQLGSGVASVATVTGAGPADTKIIHQRPALLQDLEWRPRYSSRGSAPQTDPVDHMVFSFYNDQLYRVAVDYDARRTEGMTQADMITAISTTYGVASIPGSRGVRAAEAQYGETDVALAAWGNTEYSLTLLHVSYQNAFRLIVSSTKLTELARVAGLEAVRLDALEAPQREIARQRKEADDARTTEEAAKRVNLPGFRP